MYRAITFFLLSALMWCLYCFDSKVLSVPVQQKKTVPKKIEKILEKNHCTSCHNPWVRLVGPSFVNIAKRNYTAEQIAELIKKPDPTHWPGYPSMTPQPNVPFEDIREIAKWLKSLNK